MTDYARGYADGIEAVAQKIIEVRIFEVTSIAIGALDDAMSAIRSLPLPESPATKQEPVAWRFRYSGGKWTVQKNKPYWYTRDQPDVELEPLYALQETQ